MSPDKLFIHLIIILLLLLPITQAQNNKDNIFPSDWKAAAQEMVQTQIVERGIKDASVLNVLSKTARHKFVPPDMVPYAYNDRPLPIGEDQTISQPYIVALMTELMGLSGTEKVLEIGTGSGYQAAVLSPLVAEVYTIEIVKTLALRAQTILKDLRMKNVHVRWGDGYKGWPDKAPFDRIIVTAAPDEIPSALIDQLRIGGKLVIPVGKYWQELKVITKVSTSDIDEKSIIPVRFVPMVHPSNPIVEEDLN
jgi:protein-L-isoaspartate(D-aspartate) O-methyltransferase